jgi:transcription termination/antitermination protein NusG
MWYAAYCRSNTESLVLDRLTEIHIEAFYPHLLEKSKDKKRSIEKKFFPGYVFVDADMRDPATRHLVTAVPQVVRLVGIGDHVVAITDAEIAAVRALINSPRASGLIQPCAHVVTGDRVRVIRGPLRGIEGTAQYSKKGGARIVVSIQAIGQSIGTRSELPVECLMVLPSARKAA